MAMGTSDRSDAGNDADGLPTRPSTFGYRKLGVLLLLIAAVTVLLILFRDELSLAAVAEQEQRILDFGRAHPVLVVAISFAVYVVVTGLSVPGALVLTLANGWLLTQLYGRLYGFLAAMLLVSFASAIGATIAFLLSRYLFRDVVQARFGAHLTKFNRALERDGALYLFTLRLVFHVPFFVINVVMALTPMRARTFYWVSQLGMLPVTAVLVYAGAAIPSLNELAPRLHSEGLSAIVSRQLVIAFLLLGLFPIVVKKMMARFRPSNEK
jgi:uncharacterized membrane protein YdjX (TVP38/TMEM64 family)